MSEKGAGGPLREVEIRAQARENARTTYEAIRRAFERAPEIVNGPLPRADDLPHWEALEPDVREMILNDLIDWAERRAYYKRMAGKSRC